MAEKPIKPKILKVVDFFIERLKEKGVDISYIVIFGSHAKGTATSESDLDMIVVSKDFRGKNIFKRAEMVRGAYGGTVRKFMIAIDLIMETPEEFNPEFGVVVYAA